MNTIIIITRDLGAVWIMASTFTQLGQSLVMLAEHWLHLSTGL